MPSLTCGVFDLAAADPVSGLCLKQYMEVTDGVKAYDLFCGVKGPQHVVATEGEGLRDIYVTFRNFEPDRPAHFECYVACGERGSSSKLIRFLPWELRF
jgi:hypothetical protein